MTLGHAGQRRGRHRRGAGADDALPDSGQYGAGLSVREYFWLAILGLTLIASLSSGNVLKGLMEGTFGLLLAMIRVGMGVWAGFWGWQVLVLRPLCWAWFWVRSPGRDSCGRT